MGHRLRRVIPLSAWCLAAVALAAGQDLTPVESEAMRRKLATVASLSAAERPATAARVRTSFTERELNAYLKFDGKEQLPVGLVSPRFVIADAGHVTGRAIVDLDAVRLSKPRPLLDPVNLLGGSTEVVVVGTVLAVNGQGVFQFESASIAGVAVSKSLLQVLVSHYSRTPEKPEGYSLDAPFPLPAAIKSLEIRRGAATIIQ